MFPLYNLFLILFVSLLVFKYVTRIIDASRSTDGIYPVEHHLEVDKWRKSEIESLYGLYLTSFEGSQQRFDALKSGDIFEKYANLFVDPTLIKYKKSSMIEDRISEFWIWRNRAHLSYHKVVNSFKVKFTHHSLGLDGNLLTEFEIESMMERDIIPGDRKLILSDVKQVMDHYEAITKLVDMICTSFSTQINESDVLTLHELMLHNSKVMKGYRDHNVIIHGEKVIFPQFQEVNGLVTKLYQYLNSDKFKNVDPIVQACLVHYHFARIQPFSSGNGRISRIMMNYILLKNRFPFVSFPKEKKGEYWAAVKQMEKIIKDKEFDQEIQLCSLISQYAEESITEGILMLQHDFQQHNEL